MADTSDLISAPIPGPENKGQTIMKRTTKTPKPTEFVLDKNEARFIVANYYAEQDARKREDSQVRHLGIKAEDKAVQRFLQHSADTHAGLEKDSQKMLLAFAESSKVGRWMLSQLGIGPVIAAGMLAHLDITRAPTAAHFWSFSGLNPNMKWEKGQKRPYNPSMKQLCYHFGEVAKRSSNHPDSVYGKIYRERKEFLEARNEAGYNAARAETFVTKSAEWKRILKKGKLPPGNLDRQAGNYAAKIFLSHLHAVMLWDHYGSAVAVPYSIAMLGHKHFISVPNADEFFPGLSEKLQSAVAHAETRRAA